MTVFIFTTDYGKTCSGRGHIVSPRAQLVKIISSLTLLQSHSTNRLHRRRSGHETGTGRPGVKRLMSSPANGIYRQRQPRAVQTTTRRPYSRIASYRYPQRAVFSDKTTSSSLTRG